MYYVLLVIMLVISMSIIIIVISGKDKGGPSKGGFLNNRLFPWIIYNRYTHTINFITQICFRIWRESIILETTFTRTTFVLRQLRQ